jgi:hypothetical protein
VYVADVSYGTPAFRRGHWADRLAAIDADLAAVEAHFAAKPGKGMSASAAIQAVAQPAARAAVSVKHTAPEAFHPAKDLQLPLGSASGVGQATLWYRHVSQAERWLSMPTQRVGAGFSAAIPAVYTQSPYPLQYYFELRAGNAAALHPPFNATLSNQPYYTVHKRA